MDKGMKYITARIDLVSNTLSNMLPHNNTGQSNKKKPGGQKARLFGTFAVRKIQQHRF